MTINTSLPVGRFNGVGPVTEAKMKKLGILTGADLREKSLTFLAEHFGSLAEHYHTISRGIDARPVRPNRIRKSVGAENTFAEDIEDFEAASCTLPASFWLGNPRSGKAFACSGSACQGSRCEIHRMRRSSSCSDSDKISLSFRKLKKAVSFFLAELHTGQANFASPLDHRT